MGELNNIEIDEDFDRALIDDKVNKGLKNYLSTHGPLFENDFTIELFKRFLNFYSEKDAAERRCSNWWLKKLRIFLKLKLKQDWINIKFEQFHIVYINVNNKDSIPKPCNIGKDFSV